MKSYIRRIGAALSLSIFLLLILTPAAQAQNPSSYYGCQGFNPRAGSIPAPGTAEWVQWQACLQQYLSLSPQQNAQIMPILANEAREVIAIKNNNSLSNVQKREEVRAIHHESDQQLKPLLTPAQHEKLKLAGQQAIETRRADLW
jgi:Spy/CpxP family protein refolding chaperone